MRVRLAYGRGQLEVELPERHGEGGIRVDVLEKLRVPPVADPERALRAALETPVAAAPLHEVARGRRDAVIVVSDRTRPVPNAVLLPPILDALEAAGLRRQAISVQVATGLHRPNSAAELDEMLGPELARSLHIVQHDARDADSHLDLGRTSTGIPIRLDRFYLERDLKILTGLIEPHLMAGYSGGRKAVCPGLADVETVRVAHGPEMLEGRIGPGIVEGNPLHGGLLEILRRAGADFLVNVALDRERRIAGIF
jgi:nickel-dependent lactate racemase